MAKRIFFICMALLFAASSAAAKPYLSLGGMWVDLSDADASASGGPDLDVEFDDGWGAFVAVGKQFERFRLEGEAAYRRNDIDGIDIGGISAGSGDKVEVMSGMVNGYLDFDLLQVRPFIGLGAGVARIDVDLGTVDDDDYAFAWQAMVGLSFAMQPVGFDVGYRYFDAENPKFGNFEGEYEGHNIYVAIRF